MAEQEEANGHMGKKLAILLVTLTSLVGISGFYVAGGLQAYSRYQQSFSQEHCGRQSPVHICVRAPQEIFSAYYPFYLTTHTTQFSVTYSSSSTITLIISVQLPESTQ